MNQIERGEFYRQLGEEKALRESIRNLIRFVKQKKENQQNDLRNLINKVILQERKILEPSTPDNEDEEMPPEFIDIDKDGSTPEKEVSPEEEFGAGLEGTDETGRNMAYQTFKKVEKAVLDAYELLSNPDDRELFYDYLLANLKLYFDRFETELDVSVEEPESAAYDQAQAQATEVPGELGAALA